MKKFFIDARKMGSKRSAKSNKTDTSTISSHHMQCPVERYLTQQNKSSTIKTYSNIWRQFNKFLCRLDNMPMSWENRTTLYIAYLIEEGYQSSTIKSYVSAIKKMLILDKYDWQDNEVLLASLTKACRIINDKVTTRLPIQHSLFETILFELERVFPTQIYLQYLFKAAFVLSYYGMMRVGEIAEGEHILKVKNVNIAKNFCSSYTALKHTTKEIGHKTLQYQ